VNNYYEQAYFDRELCTLWSMEVRHMTTRCPIVLRLTGCQRCGDRVESYVLRYTDNGLLRVSVCKPCAEMLDRKDEAKSKQFSSFEEEVI